jgi:hypothetical protein
VQRWCIADDINLEQRAQCNRVDLHCATSSLFRAAFGRVLNIVGCAMARQLPALGLLPYALIV